MFVLALDHAAAAVDTPAVVKAVNGILTAVGDGWLPQGFRDWCAALVLGTPIAAGIFALEWVGVAITRMSPLIDATLGKWLSKASFILNPLLAALFAGGIFHNPLIGLGAGVAWGIVNSGLSKLGATTPAGLLKAKGAAVALVALLALGGASRAYAQKAGVPLTPAELAAGAPAHQHIGWLSLTRFSLSPGAGYRWERDLGNSYAVPYWDAQLGYAPLDHLKLTSRLGHNLGPVEGGVAFYEARVGLVF